MTENVKLSNMQNREGKKKNKKFWYKRWKKKNIIEHAKINDGK